jgi:hypothetical protein
MVSHARQRGLYTVEFAIVAGVFFLLLFGAFEVARMFWVLDTLTEVTRKGARVAAVCPVNHAGVARVAVMSDPAGSDSSPYLKDLSTANIDITYTSEDGSITTNYPDIEFVTVRIVNYTHRLIIPFLPADLATITMPPVATTLPSESLGYIPDLDVRQCFGA